MKTYFDGEYIGICTFDYWYAIDAFIQMKKRKDELYSIDYKESLGTIENLKIKKTGIQLRTSKKHTITYVV